MATSTFYGDLVNYLVLPTENDHYGDGYGGVGAGMIPTELQFNPLIAAQSAIAGHVVSGFEPPASGTFQSPYVVADVTAGAATINGYRIVGTDAISVNLTASTTNYLFLKLELDGNNRVIRPLLHVDDSSYTRPSNSIPLGEVTTDASSITGTVDLRVENKMCYGTVSVSGTTATITKRGSGDWTATYAGAGDCTITFSPSFSYTAPIVHVTGHGSGNAVGYAQSTTTSSTSILHDTDGVFSFTAFS
jgi:hypothetical protein